MQVIEPDGIAVLRLKAVVFPDLPPKPSTLTFNSLTFNLYPLTFTLYPLTFTYDKERDGAISQRHHPSITKIQVLICETDLRGINPGDRLLLSQEGCQCFVKSNLFYGFTTFVMT